MDKDTKQYIDTKVDQLDNRIDQTNERIDELILVMKDSFDDVAKQFDNVAKQFDNVAKQFDNVDKQFDSVYKKFDSFKVELKEELMAEMDTRIAVLQRNLMEGNERIIQMLSKKESEDASQLRVNRRHENILDDHSEVIEIHEQRIGVLEHQII